jgi:hypothetical protein
MLAKALAHFFEAKLLLLDPTDFLIKVWYGAFVFFSCRKYILHLLMQFAL